MKALPLIALFALVGVAGAAAESAPPPPLVVEDLTFTAGGEYQQDRVDIRSERGQSSMSVERARLSEARGLDGGDGPVSFSVVAEAGRTDCVGNRKGRTVRGTCRFTSAPAFETGLAQRGVPLKRRRDLLALALIDAKLALVDDLSRDDLKPGDSGDLIAATALGVTGPWAHDLRTGGLIINRFNDLIAARALKVDGAFLKEMAAAGYPRLTAEQAITMKAVGVTPQYAEAMNRSQRVARALEGMGELQ